jgi:hypothetical protein
MLTKSGVKLLDFGLAKPMSEELASGQTLGVISAIVPECNAEVIPADPIAPLLPGVISQPRHLFIDG